MNFLLVMIIFIKNFLYEYHFYPNLLLYINYKILWVIVFVVVHNSVVSQTRHYKVKKAMILGIVRI
jgi:hypothetical protein